MWVRERERLHISFCMWLGCIPPPGFIALLWDFCIIFLWKLHICTIRSLISAIQLFTGTVQRSASRSRCLSHPYLRNYQFYYTNINNKCLLLYIVDIFSDGWKSESFHPLEECSMLKWSLYRFSCVYVCWMRSAPNDLPPPSSNMTFSVWLHTAQNPNFRLMKFILRAWIIYNHQVFSPNVLQ